MSWRGVWVRHSTERSSRGWDSRRVLPYIQQYEFESLLFSDVDAFAIVSSGISNEAVRTLRHVRSQFPSPEDINDGWTTAPSKRIAEAMPKYRKVVHGPLIAGETGLGAIRRECRRFNAWMERLDTLAGTAPRRLLRAAAVVTEVELASCRSVSPFPTAQGRRLRWSRTHRPRGHHAGDDFSSPSRRPDPRELGAARHARPPDADGTWACWTGCARTFSAMRGMADAVEFVRGESMVRRAGHAARCLRIAANPRM